MMEAYSDTGSSPNSVYSMMTLPYTTHASVIGLEGFSVIPVGNICGEKVDRNQVSITRIPMGNVQIVSHRTIAIDTERTLEIVLSDMSLHFVIPFSRANQYIGSGEACSQRADDLTRIVEQEMHSIDWNTLHQPSEPTRKEECRNLVQGVFQDLVAGMTGVNSSSRTIPFGEYFIPGRSAFHQSKLSRDTADNIRSLLADLGSNGTDIIVIDPPWPSKSTNRRGIYATLSLDSIKKGLGPFESLLMRNGILAVWVTNDPKITEFLMCQLFPSWGVSAIAQWAWVKVTSSFQPVIPYSNRARKCYERILVAVKTDIKYDFSLNGIDRFIVSQPCGLHSFKPPLDFLLDELLPHKVRRPPRVELFARIVKPGYVCWGDQVLLCNHKSLWSAKT